MFDDGKKALSRIPQDPRLARGSSCANEESYNNLDSMIKLAWKTTLLIFFEKFSDSPPTIPTAFI